LVARLGKGNRQGSRLFHQAGEEYTGWQAGLVARLVEGNRQGSRLFHQAGRKETGWQTTLMG